MSATSGLPSVAGTLKYKHARPYNYVQNVYFFFVYAGVRSDWKINLFSRVGDFQMPFAIRSEFMVLFFKVMQM
jgi:hypothetical protein